MKDLRFVVIHHAGPKWAADVPLQSGLLTYEVRQCLVGTKR